LTELAYEDEQFTDYLGGPSEEDVLAAALEPGGIIRFGYDGKGEALSAVTEYRCRRPLTADELHLLVEYTMGQWSDGIGENWTCESANRCGYTIMCLTPGMTSVRTIQWLKSRGIAAPFAANRGRGFLPVPRPLAAQHRQEDSAAMPHVWTLSGRFFGACFSRLAHVSHGL